jgi:serine/threonine-protein kinase
MHDTTIYDPTPAVCVEDGPARDGCRVCGAALPAGSANGFGSQPLRVRDFVCAACRQQIRSHPQPLPGYRLVRALGRGGLGVVFQALRGCNAALIALKTIKPAVPGTSEEHEQFLAEARGLRALHHPNIVKFHEMGEHCGLFYFAMEYVPGPDLGHLVKEQRGPLPVARAAAQVCALLGALEYAHARGFIHRDVKPANVLVAQDSGREVVKLADFGLSRIYQTTPMSGLTLEGDLGGSPAFMAPEQFTELRSAFPAVDQYSAGAVLYYLLTARLPYDFPERLEQKIMKILLEDSVPVRARRPDLPEGLTAIIDRALARKPEDRFETVGQMAQALVAFAR